MNKFNNKGWSTAMFLFLVVILLLALCVIAILVNKLNNSLVINKPENIESQIEMYKRYEKTIKREARIYASNNGDFDVVDIYNLNVSYVIKSKCTGYVTNDNGVYNPYIRCGSYETVGYDDYLD